MKVFSQKHFLISLFILYLAATVTATVTHDDLSDPNTGWESGVQVTCWPLSTESSDGLFHCVYTDVLAAPVVAAVGVCGFLPWTVGRWAGGTVCLCVGVSSPPGGRQTRVLSNPFRRFALESHTLFWRVNLFWRSKYYFSWVLFPMFLGASRFFSS